MRAESLEVRSLRSLPLGWKKGLEGCHPGDPVILSEVEGSFSEFFP